MYYEFKHHSSEATLKRRSFDFRKLEQLAVIRFVECPNFLTLVLHTDSTDTTPLHCKTEGSLQVMDFFVPQQLFIFQTSPEGLRFSVVKVRDVEGVYFWLIVCELNKQGFLVTLDTLNESGFPVEDEK